MTSTHDIFYKLKLLSKKWNNYFEIYDNILAPFKGKKPKMLEIGVAHGGSLEMWIKYFEEEVQLYAVDINKEFLDYKKGKKDDEFNREVLCICNSKLELTYWETAYQCKCNVLFVNSYNDNVLGKFFKKDFAPNALLHTL
jgi:hypothetical protein